MSFSNYICMFFIWISGAAIEKLCDYSGKCVEGHAVPRAVSDRAAMVRSARCLLAAVTRVLLLADSVVVKQLLLAKDKVSFVKLKKKRCKMKKPYSLQFAKIFKTCEITLMDM
jgi:hypothetical protein